VRRRTAAGLLLIVCVALAAGAAARAGDERSGQTTTLRVGYAFGIDAAAIGDRVAFARLRRTRRIAAELSDLGAAQPALAALLRGDVDMGIFGLHSSVNAIRQGAPIRAVLAVRPVNEWLFVSTTRTVAELRGKRVGHQAPGTETQAFARVVLRRAGLDDDDVQLLAVPGSPNRAAALIGGRLDATWLEYVDYRRILRQRRDLRVLARARRLVPFSALQVLVVTEEYLREHRPLLRRVVAGLLDGYERLYTLAGRREFVAAARPVIQDESDAFIRSVYAYYKQIRFWPRRARPVTSRQWQGRVRFWAQNQMVQTPVPAFSRVWDLSFWRQAARQQRRR
jgi:NitT/TauT family transport system substrate-binding protein